MFHRVLIWIAMFYSDVRSLSTPILFVLHTWVLIIGTRGCDVCTLFQMSLSIGPAALALGFMI